MLMLMLLSFAPCAVQDALEYGLIDEVIQPNVEKTEKAASYWLKSGRAESDDRLEQWKQYIELQEKYSMKDQFRKVRNWLGVTTRFVGCCCLGLRAQWALLDQAKVDGCLEGKEVHIGRHKKYNFRAVRERGATCYI